ncbi:MAG: hypothetical protein GW938_12575 [Leptospira sp.]|jgi:hypothetical protein|nr:hypothetical protein [Leptospira sp.]NCS94051.1 hypothetical protein [Leptospira sp.]
MNKFLKTISLLVLLSPFHFIYATMEFIIESDKERQYEIEFFTNGKEPQNELFQGNNYKKEEPISFDSFRIRTIGPYNSKGFWSEYKSVSDFTKSNSISSIKLEDKKPVKSDEVFIVLEEKGQKTFFLNGDKVGFEISKSKVGIEKTYYRLNGGEWNTYTEQGLRFIKDGEYQMDYYSVDRIGNKETTKSVNFVVDIIAPQTELNYIKPENILFPKGYISGETKIQFIARDEVSGIDYTNYRFVCNNGKVTEFKKFLEPVSIKQPIDYCKSGFQIQFFSVDKVGNREDLRTFLFSYIE